MENEKFIKKEESDFEINNQLKELKKELRSKVISFITKAKNDLPTQRQINAWDQTLKFLEAISLREGENLNQFLERNEHLLEVPAVALEPGDLIFQKQCLEKWFSVREMLLSKVNATSGQKEVSLQKLKKELEDAKDILIKFVQTTPQETDSKKALETCKKYLIDIKDDNAILWSEPKKDAGRNILFLNYPEIKYQFWQLELNYYRESNLQELHLLQQEAQNKKDSLPWQFWMKTKEVCAQVSDMIYGNKKEEPKRDVENVSVKNPKGTESEPKKEGKEEEMTLFTSKTKLSR